MDWGSGKKTLRTRQRLLMNEVRFLCCPQERRIKRGIIARFFLGLGPIRFQAVRIPMKRVLMCMFLLPVCLGSVPLASATWGGFVSTGIATGIGNPSCAFVSTDHVACAVRSGASQLMVNVFNGSKGEPG